MHTPDVEVDAQQIIFGTAVNYDGGVGLQAHEGGELLHQMARLSGRRDGCVHNLCCYSSPVNAQYDGRLYVVAGQPISLLSGARWENGKVAGRQRVDAEL